LRVVAGAADQQRPRRQHHLAFQLLEVLERECHAVGIGLLAQARPVQGFQAALAGTFHAQLQATAVDRAAVEVLGEGGGEVPGLVGLWLQLQLMHGQAAALGGGADEALVERHVRTQAGNLFIALAQRVLQVAIGLATDLVRARKRGHPLFQLLDARLGLAPLGRARDTGGRRKHLPGTPQAEHQRQHAHPAQRMHHCARTAAHRQQVGSARFGGVGRLGRGHRRSIASAT